MKCFGQFFENNYDIFAWSQSDVPGIDYQIAIHKLFIDPGHPLVCQKRRKFVLERLKVHLIRESHYLDWLTNVVVDFTNLNKACP